MNGELYDLRGAQKAPKLRERRKEEPNKRWLEEARRIARIKDADILKRLKMKKVVK